MRVRLVAHTFEPDMVCAAAAYTSWKKRSTDRLISQLDEREASKFLEKVMGFGHLSVTEHATFTFSISGISRACSHQLVRHRIASYTQQSQRYVRFKKSELKYVTPPSIKKAGLEERYAKIMEQIAEAYEELSKYVPVEDARYVLPNAAHTNIVVTMNARELNHFFGLRLCERSQWEIRELAERMLREVRKVAPVLFSKAGPRCESLGYCPEGELSCGRMPTKEEVLGKRP